MGMSEFFTAELAVRLITAFIGTVCFSIVFKVRAALLPYAGICGFFTYAIFYTVNFLGNSLFAAAFAAASFTALFSEIFARLKRAPAIVFLLPGWIPIVPGGDLYYMMKHLLANDFGTASEYALSAVKTGIGIAGGMVAVSVLCGLVFQKKRVFK